MTLHTFLYRHSGSHNTHCTHHSNRGDKPPLYIHTLIHAICSVTINIYLYTYIYIYHHVWAGSTVVTRTP